MSNKTILVLGGYGSTGKVFCQYLLKETSANVVIGGRKIEKAEELANKLKREFPQDRISTQYVDASDAESLRKAFVNIDFVLVASTTAKWAKQIAELALEANIDYLDVYFQQDVYPILETLKQQITDAGRCFITQSGFHPGMPAAYVREGAQYFDKYEKAIVAFAMNVRVEKSESVYELLEAFLDYKPEIYQNGEWKIGTFNDTIMIDYGNQFGVKASMSLDLIELRPLPKMYGLQEAGVYTTGFNWFVDYIFFPLFMMSQAVKKKSLWRFFAWLFVFGINNFSSNKEGVVMLLQAEGEKDGKRRKVKIISEHDNAYDFTVIPVVACLKQLFTGSLNKPGLWMMGHLVDTSKLFTDMEKMGVITSISTQNSNQNL